MKIEIWCDNGANIHSKRVRVYTLEQLGIDEEEWKAMTEDQRMDMVHDITCEWVNYGFNEKP